MRKKLRHLESKTKQSREKVEVEMEMESGKSENAQNHEPKTEDLQYHSRRFRGDFQRYIFCLSGNK